MSRRTAIAGFFFVVVAGCHQPPAETSSTSSPAPAASSAPPTKTLQRAALTRVDEPSKVCMVNDQYMDKTQIPVRVGDKTYFGCCAMCKEKLEKNEAARTSVDPVSGARVDKSAAVIARDASNKVYYFESEATMGSFSL